MPSLARASAGPEAEEAPELHFAAGLPGFSNAHRFALRPWGGDTSPFSLLESLDDAGVAFIVVPPSVFFADYEPELDDMVASRLSLATAEDALVVVIVTLGATAADATANLLGPIVVNLTTNEAAQAVLTGQRWTSRAPLRA